MLVLSRKSNESVVVGGSSGGEPLLRITVLSIAGGKVRLGFEADAEVPVHRSELWERVRAGHCRTGENDAPPTPGAEAAQPSHG